MKEQKWDDSFEDSIEFIEPPAILSEEEPHMKVVSSSDKSHLTELRRRTEERLDCKRIDLQFDFDELDE
ncbi:MAG: hypothetical protein QGG54_04915 [Gammaproteobacteria bacterium]|jgi:hypothetical protein|nr:hypothetical protein [Gammaproteobacteria bacterium]MDP6537126.1 hypothetical protein [Gammaproteobacteria bacterium]MDP6733125.1 hypothetical protein [Gammaproteobacteria bacterium]HAJ75306.1 hypothetical protein [Gammaproteobacteria bacterium]|tara:strand:+ start:3104 stop:3310 length:207 start_codon:yes stop_codon:yes gene_type:complete